MLRGTNVLTNGDGLVFRGALGPWFQIDTKKFHISADAARNLVRMVVEEYERLQGRSPCELFIHAQAAFTDEEWRGFRHGVDKETKLVGVQIVDGRDDLKLFRPGAYPVIRGTALVLSDRHAYLDVGLCAEAGYIYGAGDSEPNFSARGAWRLRADDRASRRDGFD